MNFIQSLFEYDNFLNVDEQFIVDSENNHSVGLYLHGRCHLFALKLHEMTQYPISAYIELEPWDDNYNILDKPALIHAFCMLNDSLSIDALGVRSQNTVEAEYCFESNELLVTRGEETRKLLVDWIAADLLYDYEPHEEQALERYIQLMIDNKLFVLKS